jgi:hypothetical protein
MIRVEASPIPFTRRLWFAAYSVASLIVFATIANGQQFVNGGFELPNLGPNDYSVSFPTGTGWTFSGSHAGITEGSGGFGLRYVGPPEGNQSAYLRESSSISQLVTGFEIGKQYRVEWAEGLSSNSGIGAALQLNLIDPNSHVSVIEASHLVSNALAWRENASDLFTAQSTSYTFQFQSSILPDTYGGPAIDNVRISSGPFNPFPMEIESQAELVSDSSLTIDVLLGDQFLARAVQDNLMGTVDLALLVDQSNSIQQVRFGADVTPVHFQAGTIPIGLLGDLYFQLRNPEILIGILPGGSTGVWLDAVNGDSLPIEGMNLSFLGSFYYQGRGQLPLLIGNEGSIDLEKLNTTISSTDDFNGILVNPASYTLTPTGVPNQYQVDVMLDINYTGPLSPEYQINGRISSHIHARGLVTLAVPETNATVYLAIFGVLCLPFVRRRRGFFGNSTE